MSETNQNQRSDFFQKQSLETQVEQLTQIVDMCYSSVITLFTTTEALYNLLIEKELITTDEFQEALVAVQKETEKGIAEMLGETEDNTNENGDLPLSGIQIS